MKLTARTYRICSTPSLMIQVTLLVALFPISLSSGLHPEDIQEVQSNLPLNQLKETVERFLTEPVSNGLEDQNPNTVNRNLKDFTANCEQDKITVTGCFKSKFKGRIYALDYVDDPECGSPAANGTTKNVTFSLPLGQCGVRMTVLNKNLDNDLTHTVVLYIQYSPFLQQVIDDKVIVSCTEAKKETPVPEAEQTLDNITTSFGSVTAKRSRQGRRLKTKEAPMKIGFPKSAKIGEAWMEILSGKDPSPKSKTEQPVQVGEDVTLVVSTKVTRGYDARVVNCTAHDGSRTTSDGSRVQPILDSAGCSIDRGLVPNFRRRRLPVEARHQMTLHFATFPAFKFPERDHIHVRCSVAYCQGPCPQESCDSGRNHYGTWKDKYGRVADILVETSDIVNAVEVLSPEMDINGGGGDHYERHQSSHSAGVGMASAAPHPRHLPLQQSQAQFSDTPASGSQQQQPQPSYTNGLPSLASNYHYSPHAINGQPIYTNNQIPQGAPAPPTVCISPGTVILALVILGVVLVISATATLWLALKRSEAKKFAEQKMSPFTSSPTPSPYYRFNHW